MGHDKLTTTRVALRAGVSVGTLYQYYGDKEALLRALVVAYLGRAERAMRAVLEDDAPLRTLARRLVRRFVAFKLEGGARGEALRSVFLTSNGQVVANEATNLVVAKLCQRIHVSEPSWAPARVVQIANMWATILVGSTTAMMERAPELVAEPWFGEALERALIALLEDPAR